MSSSNDFFKGLVHQATKNMIDSGDENNKTAETRLMLSILGILTFVGMEGEKIIFRQNFGKKALNMPRLILCSLCFIALSIISFCMSFPDSKDTQPEMFGTPISYFVTSILFMALGIYMFVKGKKERSKAIKKDDFSEYQGDSALLRFMVKEGWKQSTVQNFVEPFITLCIGFSYLLFNMLGGLAIMFCALSTWGYLLMKLFIIPKPLHQQVEDIHSQFSQSKQFNEI